jgi:predicted DNA-binding transcriptional regulator YafY
VTERAARRYVAILREADLPIESVSGRHGGYRIGRGLMEVDPWAVVLRHSRWYLLAWSHSRRAQRVLRVDRVVRAETRPGAFTPPADLDALRVLEEHLSQGWDYPVDVLVEATAEETARWIPRSLARLEPDEENRTRLRASTSEPDWYARQLAAIPAPMRVLGSPELRRAVADLSRHLARGTGVETRIEVVVLP